MAAASAVAGGAVMERGTAKRSPGAAPYVEPFQRLYREHGAGLAVDAADAAERAAALEELAATGFPLRHDEAWAHTPVRAVVEAKYRLAPARNLAAGVPEGLLFELVADQPQGLVTVNGSRANGPWATITANGMHHAAAHRPAATFTRSTGNAFTRLARVFGSLYELRLDGAAGAAPVHLVHLTEAGVLSAPRVRVRIADGARVTLVETFAAANGAPREAAPSLTCGETEIHLGAGAALTYVRVQAAAEGAFDLGSTTVVQERDSELHALSVAVGARLARHTLNVLAAGPGTASRLGGAGVAGGTPARQVIDNHTYLEHAAPSCASRQTYKMVLGGRGHGVFSGRILVRPVAQQTDAFQLNRNLLLDDAVVDTKPQLEIGADDVRCTHGATTGRLNKDQMFYLQTRGIPRPAAGQMLARGFLDEVVGDLPAPALRPRLLELLHRRLDRLAWSAPA
jgi:Fe-S cluster assembly protein SufD